MDGKAKFPTVGEVSHTFPLRYLNLDFPDLVGRAEAHEREIRVTAAEFFLRQLIFRFENAELHNNSVLVIDGVPHQFLYNDGFPKRTQILSVEPLQPAREKSVRVARRLRNLGT